MNFVKLRIRHILFKKIGFLIFLNDYLIHCQTVAYCLERKNKERFFSFQSMPNLQFCIGLYSKQKRLQAHIALSPAFSFSSGTDLPQVRAQPVRDPNVSETNAKLTLAGNSPILFSRW
jgi:hypothetical protein